VVTTILNDPQNRELDVYAYLPVSEEDNSGTMPISSKTKKKIKKDLGVIQKKRRKKKEYKTQICEKKKKE